MRKLSLAYLTATMLILLAFVPTFMFAHAQGHVAAAAPAWATFLRELRATQPTPTASRPIV